MEYRHSRRDHRTAPSRPHLVAERQRVAVIEGILWLAMPNCFRFFAHSSPSRGLPDLLHRRQEQADQYGDDRDHHEQFHKRECRTIGPARHVSLPIRARDARILHIILFVTTRYWSKCFWLTARLKRRCQASPRTFLARESLCYRNNRKLGRKRVVTAYPIAFSPRAQGIEHRFPKQKSNTKPRISGVFAFFLTPAALPDPAHGCQRVSAGVSPLTSITTIAVLTFVPCSLNEPAGRSIQSAQIGASPSRCRGPLARSPPAGRRGRAWRRRVGCGRCPRRGERRVHHDPVELAELAVEATEVGTVDRHERIIASSVRRRGG